MRYTLSRLSNWKYILAVLTLFLIFPFVLFPSLQAQLSEAAGGPVVQLDTRFSYTTAEVRSLFDQLGTEGRDVYRTVVGVDMLFPVVYGLLFTLILAWLLKKLTRDDSPWLVLALLPAAGVLFDYLENFNNLRLLNQYPKISADAVWWGEKMTLLKHGIGLLSVGLALLLAVALLVTRIRRQSVA